MRLIDADALLRKICGCSCGCEPDECGYIDEYRKERCKAGQYVENAPIVDAVPVVRCKDCKYRAENGRCYTENGIIRGAFVGENWFCADGERRESE